MRFREATPRDEDAVFGLMREFYAEARYPHDAAKARRALAVLLADPGLGTVWVAEDGPRAVGYVVLTLGYSLEYLGRDAFVDELFVQPPHRGRGLGREALGILEAACRARGVRALHLEVETDNPEAQRLYRRAGFAGQGRRLLTRRIES